VFDNYKVYTSTLRRRVKIHENACGGTSSTCLLLFVLIGPSLFSKLKFILLLFVLVLVTRPFVWCDQDLSETQQDTARYKVVLELRPSGVSPSLSESCTQHYMQCLRNPTRLVMLT
jgi:hypothetical protein